MCATTGAMAAVTKDARIPRSKVRPFWKSALLRTACVACVLE